MNRRGRVNSVICVLAALGEPQNAVSFVREDGSLRYFEGVSRASIKRLHSRISGTWASMGHNGAAYIYENGWQWHREYTIHGDVGRDISERDWQ